GFKGHPPNRERANLYPRTVPRKPQVATSAASMSRSLDIKGSSLACFSHQAPDPTVLPCRAKNRLNCLKQPIQTNDDATNSYLAFEIDVSTKGRIRCKS